MTTDTGRITSMQLTRSGGTCQPVTLDDAERARLGERPSAERRAAYMQRIEASLKLKLGTDWRVARVGAGRKAAFDVDGLAAMVDLGDWLDVDPRIVQFVLVSALEGAEAEIERLKAPVRLDAFQIADDVPARPQAIGFYRDALQRIIDGGDAIAIAREALRTEVRP